MSSRPQIESALRHLAPKIPAHEFSAVVDHALDSVSLNSADPGTAAWLSLVAYARHVFTEYDALLTQGYDRESARHFVAEDMRAKLSDWGVRRPLATDE